MSNLWEEQQDFVRNVRGAGASILLVMLISGRSLTNKEMQRATGYSDKPVTDALAWLEPRGIVHFVSQTDGWTLGPGLAKLPFSPAQLADITRFLSAEIQPFTEAANRQPSLPAVTQDVPVRPGAASFSEAMATAAGVTAHPAPTQDRKLSDPPADEDRKVSDLRPPLVVDHVVVDHSNFHPPSTTTTTINSADQDRKLSDLLHHIGIRGRAYKRLLQKSPSAPVVQAWWWEACSNPKLTNPAGYVICRLDDGHQPSDGFLTLAATWPTFSRSDQDILAEAAEGRSGDRITGAPAESAEEMAYRLEDQFPELSLESLAAYIMMRRYAPQELATKKPG